ncbi:hypothetical protein Strop_3010 [Salinispora tropica CNB-440]|uniref:DUF5753 domain-containing protein n=1 Tax=Salinispora tropica (strain ATCC BAA-916 / DSM 44818 / JCM 13857 / NBRC 105044 / CNB-440) TaxID=369723 RepID=A4X986_SALTO|nr:hypothetical protein Strop_3010 [Salinispora tropica CNB-440]
MTDTLSTRHGMSTQHLCTLLGRPRASLEWRQDELCIAAAMVEAGETAESLAAQTGVDPKTAARWTTPGRVPQPRRRVQVATILGRDVEDLWPDVVKRREPEWLREWVDWEREAVAVRWFEHTWIPGLLQTEDYARATLAGEALTPGEVDELVASRISRQAILRTDRPRC